MYEHIHTTMYIHTSLHLAHDMCLRATVSGGCSCRRAGSENMNTFVFSARRPAAAHAIKVVHSAHSSVAAMTDLRACVV